MIKVEICPFMMERARQRDKGQMNHRSFQKGKGNLPGFLGEEMVYLLRPDWDWADRYDYDFECMGITFDAKSKKQTVGYRPEGHWQAAVAKTSLHQSCHVYVFCRVFFDEDTGKWPYGWVCGWLTKEEYLEDARAFEVGEAEGDNGYTTNEDCLCLPYDRLRPFPLLKGVTPEKFFRTPNKLARWRAMRAG
jgi:hypothetical protein